MVPFNFLIIYVIKVNTIIKGWHSKKEKGLDFYLLAIVEQKDNGSERRKSLGWIHARSIIIQEAIVWQ